MDNRINVDRAYLSVGYQVSFIVKITKMTNLIFDRSLFWGWTMDPLRLGLTFWTTRYQLPGILSFTR